MVQFRVNSKGTKAMRIRLRLNEPVIDDNHKKFMLRTVLMDTATSLMFYGNEADCYLANNPFTLDDTGTFLEATIPGTVTSTDVQGFKQMLMETINKGLLGNTNEGYQLPQGFPNIQIKVIDVENKPIKSR